MRFHLIHADLFLSDAALSTWTRNSSLRFSTPRSISLAYRNKCPRSPSTSRCASYRVLPRILVYKSFVFLQGRPFREGIRENPALWWGLVGASAVAFCGATDFMPELNRWLQIVEMQSSVRFTIQSFPSHILSDMT